MKSEEMLVFVVSRCLLYTAKERSILLATIKRLLIKSKSMYVID